MTVTTERKQEIIGQYLEHSKLFTESKELKSFRAIIRNNSKTIIDQIITKKKKAIVLAPTRELATQIEKDFRNLTIGSNFFTSPGRHSHQ